MGGAEIQGSQSALEDWVPSSFVEIENYFRAVVSRLTSFAIEADNSALSELARLRIGSSLRGLIKAGLLSEVESTVAKIANSVDGVWRAAIPSLLHSMEYDLKEKGPERDRVGALYQSLIPESLRDRIEFYVSTPSYNLFAGAADLSGQRMQLEDVLGEIASEIVSNKSVNSVIEDMKPGTHQNAAILGAKLYGRIEKSEKFAQDLVEAGRGVPSDKRNLSLFMGALGEAAKSDPNLVGNLLDETSKDEFLAEELVTLTCAAGVDDQGLLRIQAAMISGLLPEGRVRELAWGSVLSEVSAPSVAIILESLADISVEGAWVAVDIVSMYSFQDRIGRNTLRNKSPLCSVNPLC